MSASTEGRGAKALLSAARGMPLLILLFLVWAALGLRWTRIDFSPQALFAEDSVAVDEYERFKAAWGPDDHMAFLLIHDEDGPLGAAGLSALRQLAACLGHEERCAVPLSEAVGEPQSVLSAPFPRSERDPEAPAEVQRGTLTMDPLPLPADPADEAQARAFFEQARTSPLYRRWLISEDGQTAGLLFRFDEEVQAISVVRPAVEEVRALLERVRAAHPDLTLLVAGPHFYRVDVVDLMVRDQLIFVPLVGALLIAVLWFQFGTLSGVLLPLLTVAAGSIGTVAMMGHAREHISILSTLLPALILVIGVADSIHLLARFGEERRARRGQPGAHRAAVRATITAIGGACFFTSFTTAIGFGSLGVAELRILRMFGLFAAGGVMLTYLLTMALLPWAIDRFRLAPFADQKDESRLLAWLDAALQRWLAFVLRWPKAVVLTLCLPIAAGGFVLTRIPVDNFIMEYMPRSRDSYQANSLLESQLSGVVAMEVLLTLPEPDGWLDPGALARAAEVEAWLQERPEIGGVMSLLPLVRALNEAAFEQPGLPTSRRRMSQLRDMLDMGTASDGRPASEVWLDPDGSLLRLSARGADVGARRFLSLQSELDAELGRIFEGVELAIAITGVSEVGYSGIDVLIHDLLKSLGWAFLVIWAVMALLLRDVKLASLAMIPNLTPVLAVLATVAAMGGHLETISAMIFCIGLGIAVDDTIHYLTRFRELRREPGSLRSVLERTTASTGRAIVFTTVLLVAGFGVMLASSFPPNRRFAAMGVGLLIWALIADLFLLPALLWLAYSVPSERAGQAALPRRSAEPPPEIV